MAKQSFWDSMRVGIGSSLNPQQMARSLEMEANYEIMQQDIAREKKERELYNVINEIRLAGGAQSPAGRTLLSKHIGEGTFTPDMFMADPEPYDPAKQLAAMGGVGTEHGREFASQMFGGSPQGYMRESDKPKPGEETDRLLGRHKAISEAASAHKTAWQDMALDTGESGGSAADVFGPMMRRSNKNLLQATNQRSPQQQTLRSGQMQAGQALSGIQPQNPVTTESAPSNAVNKITRSKQVQAAQIKKVAPTLDAVDIVVNKPKLVDILLGLSPADLPYAIQMIEAGREEELIKMIQELSQADADSAY